jgi:hypothetical protein
MDFGYCVRKQAGDEKRRIQFLYGRIRDHCYLFFRSIPLIPETIQTDDLLTDERWQLVQRIVSSHAFQKSARMRELLQHITERAIRGHGYELTEQHIGERLFHKPSGYSPLEDSSVRVHARQLRLKLHEYFNEDGRNEPMVVEIPKGSYVPIFRPVSSHTPAAGEPHAVPAAAPTLARPVLLPWTLAVLLAVACFVLLLTRRNPATAIIATPPPWPFSEVFDKRHPTTLVVADSNYGMQRILSGERGSLDQYLRRDFANSSGVAKLGAGGSPFRAYVSESTLTSFADVADVVALLKAAGSLQGQVIVRYPRDLRIRDLDHQNFVFIGSPSSNPWVTLFQDRLNFRESEDAVGDSAKAFLNTSPQPGEKARYEGLRWTGSVGEDYATISLLPNPTHDGSILILQGLQQEGTEAAGRFLADDVNRKQLLNALGISANNVNEEIWFEALIQSRTVSGAPNSTTLIAARRIK